VLAVEDALLEHRVVSKARLRKRLPGAMRYGTLTAVLNHLEASGKIAYDGRTVLWMLPNEKLDAPDGASAVIKTGVQGASHGSHDREFQG